MHDTLSTFQQAIYWRGMLVQRYAAVEFALTQLIAAAVKHPTYAHLGAVPGKLSSKLHRVGQLGKKEPVAQFRTELTAFLARFQDFQEYRHFMVHGIMVPSKNGISIDFKMFKHIAGEFAVGDMTLMPEDLRTLAESFQPLSSDFTELIAKVCRHVIADGSLEER